MLGVAIKVCFRPSADMRGDKPHPFGVYQIGEV